MKTLTNCAETVIFEVIACLLNSKSRRLDGLSLSQKKSVIDTDNFVRRVMVITLAITLTLMGVTPILLAIIKD